MTDEHPAFDMDSRKFQGRPNALFFALESRMMDISLDELYQKGQRRFVVERILGSAADAYVLVEDALRALQQLVAVIASNSIIPC